MTRLNDALVAHWTMNDNADSNAVVDATGNHDGVYHGTGGTDDYTSSHDVTGKVNGALDFDGTQDYVEIADHDDFSFGDGSNDSPFSISAWIYMDNIVSFIVASKFVAGNYEWVIRTSSSKLIFALSHLDFSAVLERLCSTTLFNGQWYHVVGTYDGSGTTAHDGMKIYIDGARKDDTDGNYETYTAMDNGTAPVQIGRLTTNYANGKIDNAMLFNVVLTQGEIDRLYNTGRGTETLTGVEVRTTLPRRIGKSSMPLRVRYEK